MITRTVPVVVCVAALAACSGQPAARPAPHDGGTYASPRALSVAINGRTGLSCRQFTASGSPAGYPTGTCDDLGALLVVVGRQHSPDQVASELAGRGSHTFLRGRNWLIEFSAESSA